MKIVLCLHNFQLKFYKITYRKCGMNGMNNQNHQGNYLVKIGEGALIKMVNVLFVFK